MAFEKTPKKGAADGSARNGSNITVLPPAPPPMSRGTGRTLNTITGSDTAWMTPSNPNQEQVPNLIGRQMDFPVAVNLVMQPRGEHRNSFSTLRGLADAYSLVRLAIETRKDQIVKQKWKIKPFNIKQKSDKRCDELTAFFKMPDK